MLPMAACLQKAQIVAFLWESYNKQSAQAPNIQDVK